MARPSRTQCWAAILHRTPLSRITMRSCVTTTNPCSLAQAMMDSSVARWVPTVDQRTACHPSAVNTSIQSGERFMSIRNFIRTPGEGPVPPIARQRTCLQDIFPFDVGIGCQDLLNRLSRCHQAHDCADGHPHAPNTGFPSHHRRVHCDAIQLFHGVLHAIRRPAPCPTTIAVLCQQCCSGPCLSCLSRPIIAGLPRLRMARFMSSTLTSRAGGLSSPANSDASMLAGSTETTQVFRLKANYHARHESSHSTPSRFLRPWVQTEMNPSIAG